MTLDVLAIGAHPDDVEVGIGGLVAKLAAQGFRVGILDLTRGEMGSRGTPDERAREADASAQVLGVAWRDSAGLPDGSVANEPGQRLAVVRAIRATQPRMVLAPFTGDRHPDHEAAHALVRDAAYSAGLARLDTGQPAHRPKRVYYYRVYGDSSPPALIIDVTGAHETKKRALACYASQFHNPDYDGPQTYVASPEFMAGIEARAAYWGARIGVSYAEVLYAAGPVQVNWPPGLENAQ